MNDIIVYNKGYNDTFQYSVQIVKPDGTSIGVGRYVSEFNVWESMQAKAMQYKMGLVDAGGMVAQFGVQTGDTVSISLAISDNDPNKITQDFVILSIDDGDRVDNSQGRTFIMSALDMAAHLNGLNPVTKSYTGSFDQIVQGVCQDYLEIDPDDLDVEAAAGTRTLVSPGAKPFDVIGWCCQQAQNASADKDSLYFFWHTADGFNFKTVRQAVADANTHSYTVAVDKNAAGDTTDVFRILNFKQLKLGHQAQKIQGGLYENELMQFNHLNRNINSTKQNYANNASSVAVLRQQPLADLSEVSNTWISDSDSNVKGLSATLKIRSDDAAIGQQNSYQNKYNQATMQQQLFNQIGFSIEVYGNPAIRAGDILNVNAAELSAKTNKGQDWVLNGNFLIVDVRHRVWHAEQYRTFMTVYADGYDTNVMSQPGQQGN
jgi:hypothetical protein